eukprot:403345305
MDKDGAQSQVAIKIFRPEFLNSGDKAREIFIDEVTALEKLKHPNIVEIHGYGIQGQLVNDLTTMDGIWFIVLEYISERTMIDVIKQFGQLEEKTACFFFSQMLSVLNYINDMGIAHRDIKLENMLVNDQYQLKFADFGFASFSKEKQVDQKGTPVYIAPEILAGQLYDGELVDVFSSGVVLFSMISGSLPFEWAMKADPIYNLLIEERYDEFWQIFSQIVTFSDSSKDLIQGMLKFNPQQRYNLNVIRDHEWVQENSESNQSQEVKEKYTKKRAPRKNQKTRGSRSVNTGEKGGTKPFSIQGEDFLIKQETKAAYYHDEREQELAEQTTVDHLMQVFTTYCEEIQTPDLKATVSFIYEDPENPVMKKAFRISQHDKLEVDITFIIYTHADEEENDSLYLKFNLVKGNQLQMYDLINDIKVRLEDEELIL